MTNVIFVRAARRLIVKERAEVEGGERRRGSLDADDFAVKVVR